MKLRLQFGGWLAVMAISAAMALPCAAQKHEANKPSQPQRQQQQRQTPRQERRQSQQENRRPQYGRPNNNRPGKDAPHSNVPPNREPQSPQTESMGMIGGNRPPNTGNESARQPGFNPNRPPNAGNLQPRRFQDLSPVEKQRVLQNREKFNRLPPQKQQEIRDAYRNWQKLTPEQQNHIRADVLPKWRQLPPQRQKAISNRLAVLQNMPESARNQHLNDPNFTRDMSEQDKAMLRDLSHMHVGAPDPANE